jgi:hypothetical protein
MEHYKNLSLEDIVYVDENGITCVEEWINIPDYEGYYQVSNLGRIKSLERITGVKNNIYVKCAILKIGLDSHGYPRVNLSKNSSQKIFKIHRVMAEVFFNHKSTKGLHIDHINRIRHDNRIINLQVISHRLNVTKDKTNVLGLKGVYNSGNKFIARIKLNNKSICLGTFSSALEAHNKYKEAFNILESNKSIDHLIKNKNNITSYSGVHIKRNKYQAKINYNKKQYVLGVFDNPKKASDKYQEALKLIKECKSIEHLAKTRKPT